MRWYWLIPMTFIAMAFGLIIFGGSEEHFDYAFWSIGIAALAIMIGFVVDELRERGGRRRW